MFVNGVLMYSDVVLGVLAYHRFFAFLLFVPPVLGLLFLFFSRNFPYLIRRIRLLTPLYAFLIASVAFTGIVYTAILQIFNVWVIYMILLFIFLVIGEVKRYKKQRIIASYDKELQAQFIFWAKRKYMLDIIFLCLLYFLLQLNKNNLLF